MHTTCAGARLAEFPWSGTGQVEAGAEASRAARAGIATSCARAPLAALANSGGGGAEGGIRSENDQSGFTCPPLAS